MKSLIINSAKGGTGKSFVTEGIAKELAKKYKVAIIDLDTTTPNQEKIDGVITIKPTSTNIRTKTALKKYIKGAYKDLEADWVLIDTPPTISDTYIAMYEVIENAKMLFVTTASRNAIKDTGIGIRFFERRGLKGIGVIQNMLCKEFGEEFDSVEELGLPTIGTIKLGDSNFEWVKKLEELDFESTEIKTQNIVLSKMTLEDLKKDKNIPLKFYNLETWNYISDKLIENEESAMIGIDFKSRFDISVEQIKKVLAEGTHTTIQLTTAHSIDKLPMPYEIHDVEIVFNNEISKGLPMFLLRNGVYLWITEARIISERDIREILNDGGIDKGEGRIVPSLYFMLYMKRIFEREWNLDREYDLVKRYLEEVPEANKDKDFLESIYAVLEGYTKEEEVPDVEKFDEERWDTAIYSMETNMKFEKIFQLTF